MKIYLLICEHDTEVNWGSAVKPFLNREDAQTAMREDWEAEVKAWEYADHEHYNEDECDCGEDTAVIREGIDVESWRIEEHDLDVRVAVNVQGGLVQGAIANADVNVDVYDLDVSDFPDEGEEEAADAKRAEYEELSKAPGWREVW